MSDKWNQFVMQVMVARPSLELPRNFKLPCLPQSVIEFTAIANNPSVGPKELAAPIQADSALTTALMKQVNSTSVGLRQTVTSVAHAITLLGLRRTKNLVLASALQAATSKTQSRLINNIQFQRENRLRAAFARRTAQGMGADLELAHLAGLLQDFMLPLLTEAYYTEYVAAFQSQLCLAEEEKRRFGWNHAEVAAWIMRDWGFPDELVAGVLMHHDAKRILSDESLRETSVGAAIAAACIPDGLRQSESGFESLLRIQTETPGFCILEVASAVDEEISGGDSSFGTTDSLCDRLGELAEAHLEQRRTDRILEYKQLGSYMLQEQIGQGAMGVIYRAQHNMLRRSAAIKVLHSSSINQNSLTQFEAEVQLTSQLTSPNTVSVYDYGVTPEGLFYYAMELIDGVTLGHIVRQLGPLPAAVTVHTPASEGAGCFRT